MHPGMCSNEAKNVFKSTRFSCSLISPLKTDKTVVKIKSMKVNKYMDIYLEKLIIKTMTFKFKLPK